MKRQFLRRVKNENKKRRSSVRLRYLGLLWCSNSKNLNPSRAKNKRIPDGTLCDFLIVSETPAVRLFGFFETSLRAKNEKSSKVSFHFVVVSETPAAQLFGFFESSLTGKNQ